MYEQVNWAEKDKKIRVAQACNLAHNEYVKAVEKDEALEWNEDKMVNVTKRIVKWIDRCETEILNPLGQTKLNFNKGEKNV